MTAAAREEKRPVRLHTVKYLARFLHSNDQASQWRQTYYTETNCLQPYSSDYWCDSGEQSDSARICVFLLCSVGNILCLL